MIALASNGKASSTRARHGSFRLRPPASRVTLQLRAPDGVYAGPVVLGNEKKGRRAIVGVKAGAKLGKIRVRRGYASLSKKLATKWIDIKRWAKAKKGVPIGARNFGHLESGRKRLYPLHRDGRVCLERFRGQHLGDVQAAVVGRRRRTRRHCFSLLLEAHSAEVRLLDVKLEDRFSSRLGEILGRIGLTRVHAGDLDAGFGSGG